MTRRLQEEAKISNARLRKLELEKQNLDKVVNHLVRWDKFRERKEALTKMYVDARQILAMKKIWTFMVLFYAKMKTIHLRFKTKVI